MTTPPWWREKVSVYYKYTPKMPRYTFNDHTTHVYRHRKWFYLNIYNTLIYIYKLHEYDVMNTINTRYQGIKVSTLSSNQLLTCDWVPLHRLQPITALATPLRTVNWSTQRWRHSYYVLCCYPRCMHLNMQK